MQFSYFRGFSNPSPWPGAGAWCLSGQAALGPESRALLPPARRVLLAWNKACAAQLLGCTYRLFPAWSELCMCSLVAGLHMPSSVSPPVWSELPCQSMREFFFSMELDCGSRNVENHCPTCSMKEYRLEKVVPPLYQCYNIHYFIHYFVSYWTITCNVNRWFPVWVKCIFNGPTLYF